MSDWQLYVDRFEVDLNDRFVQTSSSETIRIYVDTTRVLNNDSNSELLANLNLARAWLSKNHSKGIAFDYELLLE
jgi:hypothetical protein